MIERLARREIKQTDAARLLSRSVRQVRRMLKRYRQRGAKGLASRRRGQPANNRLDARLREQIPKLIAEHYADFGPTLATEKLAERHHIHVSVESVRQLMICNQLWQVRRRRHKAVHPLRPLRFLTGYNRRFGKPPQIDIDVHRPVREQPADLDLILSRHPRSIPGVTFPGKSLSPSSTGPQHDSLSSTHCPTSGHFSLRETRTFLLWVYRQFICRSRPNIERVRLLATYKRSL